MSENGIAVFKLSLSQTGELFMAIAATVGGRLSCDIMMTGEQ